MKIKIILLFALIFIIGIISIIPKQVNLSKRENKEITKENNYWLFLHRKSNKEYLYQGVPGDLSKSELIKLFTVKTGIPNEAPTPLPKILGKKYWRIIDKEMEPDSQNVGPHFLTLDIPSDGEYPFGPTPYEECIGQCNWLIPGYFGLHGVGGDLSKLSANDPGSLGCVRHKDEDITYLYNVINPKEQEVRYYIEDI